MTNNTITITSEGQGERLDKFLVQAMPDTSRSQIQKAIKDGSVLVNGKNATVHQFLKEGDEIIIVAEASQPQKKTSETKPVKEGSVRTTQTDLFKQIKIIEDNDDFLIIEKPAGLLVHPTDKNETDTLVDWLISKYPKLKQIGEDPQRPAIVHRLDKEVSGLMVIPKNQDSFDYFKHLFKTREMTKKYTALTYGEVAKDEDEITFPIGRSKSSSGLFVARPKDQQEGDKNAHTKFNTIKRFKNYSLLEVQILTGRTHQIRVHLLAYGHPIVGDSLYGKKSHAGKQAILDRIFLHAGYLSFTAPDGKNHEFQSPLPTVLNDFLKKLKPIA